MLAKAYKNADQKPCNLNVISFIVWKEELKCYWTIVPSLLNRCHSLPSAHPNTIWKGQKAILAEKLTLKHFWWPWFRWGLSLLQRKVPWGNQPQSLPHEKHISSIEISGNRNNNREKMKLIKSIKISGNGNQPAK